VAGTAKGGPAGRVACSGERVACVADLRDERVRATGSLDAGSGVSVRLGQSADRGSQVVGVRHRGQVAVEQASRVGLDRVECEIGHVLVDVGPVENRAGNASPHYSSIARSLRFSETSRPPNTGPLSLAGAGSSASDSSCAASRS
jgi:hypothetical protein